MTITAKKARMTGQIKAGKARFSSVVLGAEPATGDAVAGDVLTGKTFSNADDAGIEGTMPNRGAVSITPSATDQAILSGYHNGSGVVTGDADLVAGNIKTGVTVFGVEGTFEGDTSAIKTALDAANEETSADVDAAIALADANYGAIKDALTAKGVDMTGVKPSGYNDAIAQAVYETAFSFDVAYKSIAHYDHASFGNTPVIPATIRGHTVEKMGLARDGAFWSGFRNMPLKYCVFPDQPIDVQITTFYNCGLKALKLADNSIIGNLALYNPIVCAKLGANIDIYDDTSASSNSGLKTVYDAGIKAAGVFVYTAGSWKLVENCTDSFSMENAPFVRADYVAIFNSLQTVVDKTITITGGYEVADLTAADLLIATGKGWTVTI